MANCPNINEEKSGPTGGWFCNVCGEPVGSDFFTNYCDSNVNCEYCPYNGGDDRIRNPEALTEEICDRIRRSVRMNMDNGERLLHIFLGELCGLAVQTQYEYLCGKIEDAAMSRISQPSLKGQLVDVVVTDIEKERAEELEEDLNHMFWGIEPANYVWRFSVSGEQLQISSYDFEKLIALIENSSYNIGAALDGGVDAGGISKYEEPVNRAQRELENSVNGYLQGILGAVNESQNTYEYGCSLTFASIGQMGMSAPGGPKWEI